VAGVSMDGVPFSGCENKRGTLCSVRAGHTMLYGREGKNPLFVQLLSFRDAS